MNEGWIVLLVFAPAAYVQWLLWPGRAARAAERRRNRGRSPDARRT